MRLSKETRGQTRGFWHERAAAKERVEMYARRVAMSAFELTPDIDMGQSAPATHVYERLKFDLTLFFDSIAPVSDRCPVCGKPIEKS